MKISEKGLKLIKEFEGLRLERYFCPAGKSTIGYGHLIKTGDALKITEEEADELLIKDVEVFEKELLDIVTVPLSQDQFDALLSFTFNMGITQVRTSTLIRKLNCRLILDCPDEFLRWCYIGKDKNFGLMKRRLKEACLFMSI